VRIFRRFMARGIPIIKDRIGMPKMCLKA